MGVSRRGLRVGKRVFQIAIAVVVAAGAIKLYGPLATNRRQQNELTRLRLEKQTLAAEYRRLDERKQQLASDAGLEGAVRREGYIREGERRLVFVPPKDEKKASSPTPSAQAPAKPQPSKRPPQQKSKAP